MIWVLAYLMFAAGVSVGFFKSALADRQGFRRWWYVHTPAGILAGLFWPVVAVVLVWELVAAARRSG